MNLFEIKVFTQVDSDSPIVERIGELIGKEELFSIKQSWENGYHVCLFGLLEQERAEEIKSSLEQVLNEQPAALYDVEDFKRKYEPVAKLTQLNEGLEPIYQNQVHLTLIEGYDLFENREQLLLYLTIHRIFDRHFAQRYFGENEILDVILEMYPFVEYLPETTYEDSVLKTSGYTSHLSHYVGLLNSLKQGDREKIRKRFDARLEEDLALFHQRKQRITQGLLDDLQQVYQQVTTYVQEGHLNFFSPSQFEDILPHLSKYNERHAVLFREKKYRDQVLTDPVSCTNKWVLNVLYEKLVLMNIKPLEKFYLNYFFSRLKYHESALEV